MITAEIAVPEMHYLVQGVVHSTYGNKMQCRGMCKELFLADSIFFKREILLARTNKVNTTIYAHSSNIHRVTDAETRLP